MPAKMQETSPPKLKKIFSDLLSLRKVRQVVFYLLFKLLTFTYSGAYNHHTRIPIGLIELHQDYFQTKSSTVESLVQFRQTKTEELRFVQGAVRKFCRFNKREAN
jgi:hypothetical protein